MKAWLLFGAGLLVCAFSACGVLPTSTGLTPSPQPATDNSAINTPAAVTSVSAAPTAVPQTTLTSEISTPETAADSSTIAVLERSGGIAGVLMTFVVKSNGDVTVGGSTKRVAGGPSAAASLASELEKTGIYAVPPGEYLPKNACCDRYDYKLTLMKDGKTYRYHTVEDSENAPSALKDAIALVEKYVGTAH